MTNRGFTTAERLHHTILANAAIRSANTCPECGKPVDTDLLKKFPKCTGYRCRPCNWEGEPRATLNAQGVMVRATAEGLPTSEVLQ